MLTGHIQRKVHPGVINGVGWSLTRAVLILAKHEVVLTIIIRVGFLLLVIIIIDACQMSAYTTVGGGA